MSNNYDTNDVIFESFSVAIATNSNFLSHGTEGMCLRRGGKYYMSFVEFKSLQWWTNFVNLLTFQQVRVIDGVCYVCSSSEEDVSC